MELEVLNMDLTVCTLASAEDLGPAKDFFFLAKMLRVKWFTLESMQK